MVRAEPYGAASAYRVFRDPVRRLLGLERDTPEAMGQALLATLAHGRPGPAADGPAARGRRPGGRAQHPRGRPARPAVPPRPAGRRRRPAGGRDDARVRSCSSPRRRTGRTVRPRACSTGSPRPAPGGPWAVVVGAAGRGGRLRPGRRYPRHAGAAAAGGHGAAGHRRDRGHAAAPARDRRRRRPRPGQPAVRRGGHPGRPGHRVAGRAARVRPGGHERPDRPAAPGCPAGPALLRRPRSQLPGRGAAPDAGHGRAGGRRLDPEQPAGRSCSRTAPTGGSSATAWSATRPTRASPTRSAAACTARPARRWRR